MSFLRFSSPTLLCAALSAAFPLLANAQTATASSSSSEEVKELSTIRVVPSADASKTGLPDSFAGGQVAKGARTGVLGNRSHLENPFATTAYTNKFIQDKQARSVGEVLQNDPNVRVARGYGNFQESYIIRGLPTASDDVQFNGLYGLMPRQYIASELFERVEVLRGASAFLNGSSVSGGAAGGSINLLPKRAPFEGITRVTAGYGAGQRGYLATDIGRRFGANQEFGVRLNATYHDGKTPIDDEQSRLGAVHLGLDWRNERTRVSADIGYQNNQLDETRTNVTLSSALKTVPEAPDGSHNWAQPWTYSNERDLFGAVRAEHDFSDKLTAYAAYGIRQSKESNSLANLTVNNLDGQGTQYRFDNTRKETVHTGEMGLRGQLQTGSLKHDWVLAGNAYYQDRKNAYVMDYRNTFATNLYQPIYRDAPAYSNALFGNQLSDPQTTNRTRLHSLAFGDTISALDDKLLLTLGARWQRIQTEGYAYNTGLQNSQYQKTRLSPSLGAVYRITPRWSVYGNYIESLAQGATVSDKTARNFGEALKPYVSKQKEIGVKYQGERFGAGLALFHTARPRIATRNGISGENGRDRFQGAELNVYGEAYPGVRLLGGIVLLDTKQKDTDSALTEGKRVIGTTQHQTTFGAEWDVPKVKGLTLDTRLTYTGSAYADHANTLKVKDWTRWDIGARYRTQIAGYDATFRARVDNVTNQKYWASIGGDGKNGYLNAGAPRSVSLSVSMDF